MSLRDDFLRDCFVHPDDGPIVRAVKDAMSESILRSSDPPVEFLDLLSEGEDAQAQGNYGFFKFLLRAGSPPCEFSLRVAGGGRSTIPVPSVPSRFALLTLEVRLRGELCAHRFGWGWKRREIERRVRRNRWIGKYVNTGPHSSDVFALDEVHHRHLERMRGVLRRRQWWPYR